MLKPAPGLGRARSLLSLLATLLALVLVMTACGGSGDESDTATDGAEASTDDADDAMQDEAMEEEFAADDAMEDDAMADEEFALNIDDSGADAGGADEPASDSTDDPDSGQGDSAEEGSDEGDSDELGAGAVASTQQTAADLGRKIIFNAFITVEVDDVAAAGQRATEIIAGFDGFVYGQETSTGAAPESTLVFKVLPADFDAAVEALGTVGELRAQSISADDVTDRIVNLETRIEVAELGVERLRATLTDTTDLADYAELERLLLDRESELEVMRAQIRSLQDQVNLATITLTLTQDRVNHELTVVASTYEAHDGGQSCPGDESGSIDEGTDFTVCFEIVNVGEEPVVDLTVIDPSLDIDSLDDLIVVYGDPSRLEAGQAIGLALETTADRDLNLRTKVTARPADAAGEIEGPSVDTRVLDRRINVRQAADEPGFTDGFDTGVDVLGTIWSVVRVVVGFLLPLLVLAPFLIAAWMGLGRLGRRRANRGPRIVRKDRRASAITRRPVDIDSPPPPPPGSQPGPGSGSATGPGPRPEDGSENDPTNIFGDE